jgi:hypothetical protein
VKIIFSKEWCLRTGLAIALFSFLGAAASAQSREGSDLFETQVRPIFVAKFQACHNSKTRMGGLDLSTAAGFQKGAESGPLFLKDDTEHSRLMQALSYSGSVKMPPTGKLSDKERADISAWIKRGAPWPQETVSANGAKGGPFWSFQRIAHPAPPAVADRPWPRSPIDSFVLAKLEAAGLAPAKQADKFTLLRRATFDLTGLPPTEQEIRDFLSDQTENAFAHVVDRLLASPRYGERWGRHWLDVARYADSTGADEDYRYPYAWRYRDYVISSFNKDLPYDRFVLEQLAGDLLPPTQPGGVNAEGIVATGFLALGPKLVAEQDKVKMVYDIVDEQIDVTSRALLGLTVACARCHDHKFDPIPTKDYYSLASIFASTKQLSKIEGTVSKLYFVPLVPESEAGAYKRYQDELQAKEKAIEAIVREEHSRYVAALRLQLAEYMTAAEEVYSGRKSAAESVADRHLQASVLDRWVAYLKPRKERRPHLDEWYKLSASSVQQAADAYSKRFDTTLEGWEARLVEWQRALADAAAAGKPMPDPPSFVAGKDRFFAEVYFGKGPFAFPEKDPDRDPLLTAAALSRVSQLRAAIETLKKTGPHEPPMACAVTEGPDVQQNVFIRGNPNAKGDAVPKRFPGALTGGRQPDIATGSGRLELGRWVANPDNPLTARVMANRIWQWHFGEGLVRTPSNFGKMGEAPTHPELLDYLATRFIESGWSIKSMHRLIMLSNTYQMDSAISPKAAEDDPANRLLSHFSRRRLDVEEIRDGLLAVNGSLDFTVGGSLVEGAGTDVEFADGRLSFNPANSNRRSVYLPLRRSNLPSILSLFDFGDATTTGEGRARTNVAPQALFMMNSQFVAKQSESLAKMLLKDDSLDDAGRIRRGYLIALGREPDAADGEVQSALDYIASMERRLGGTDSRLKAWRSYCRVLVSSNDFVYVN